MISERPTQAWRAAVIAWIGVIFFSSTSTANQWGEYLFTRLFGRTHHDQGRFDLLHFLAHKSVHVTLFCVFAILLWQALPNVRQKTVRILLWGAVVGSCSELLQSFFPDRDPALRDVLINVGGTALGLAVCKIRARLLTHHQVRA